MLNTLAIERIRLIFIKVKNINDKVILPTYETSSSAGMDIRAFLPNGKVSISPKETKLIGTGLFFEIPNGFEVQIRPRSGLALKNFITVLNSPGTIDADYRGEIKVILINHGLEMFEVEDKIFNSKYNNGILIGRSGDFLNLGNVSKTIFANKIVKYISNRKN